MNALYNRYIPGENGTYQCKRVEEIPVPEQPEPAQAPPAPPYLPPPPPPPPPRGALQGLLGRFLPPGVDVGDLLILLILLLLLADSDDGDDSLSLLLTAAAFLFMK